MQEAGILMANPPQPLPDRGRQLSQLLEEQQEPFLPEVDLVERGCSDRLLIIQGRNMCCWPIDSCKRLHCLQVHGFTRSCRRFKCMLIKFLKGRVVREVMSWNKKALSSPGTRSKNNTFDRSGNSEQLSPTSVLDMQSHEGSPGNKEEDASTLDLESPSKDLDIFRQLVELAYTCALKQFAKSKQQFGVPKKLLLDCKQDDNRMLVSEGCLDHEESNSWQRPKDDHDLITSVSQLSFSDTFNSMREWSESQIHVKEIAAQIGEAILEDLREDVVFQMLGFGCEYERS